MLKIDNIFIGGKITEKIYAHTRRSMRTNRTCRPLPAPRPREQMSVCICGGGGESTVYTAISKANEFAHDFMSAKVESIPRHTTGSCVLSGVHFHTAGSTKPDRGNHAIHAVSRQSVMNTVGSVHIHDMPRRHIS